MASHVLCDFEALVILRFRHLGHYVLKPGNFADIRQQGTALCSKCWAAECLSEGLHKRFTVVKVKVHHNAHPMYSTLLYSSRIVVGPNREVSCRTLFRNLNLTSLTVDSYTVLTFFVVSVENIQTNSHTHNTSTRCRYDTHTC